MRAGQTPGRATRKDRMKGLKTNMAHKIAEVEGIGPVYAQKLAAVGIQTTEDLLQKAGPAKGRAELCEQSGIAAALILKWVNHVDLMRISGVGPQYAELLEAAGVDTVKELAQRNAVNLAAKLSEVNNRKNLAGTSPAETQVQAWIEQAKSLDRKISY